MLVHQLADRWRVPLETIEAMPMATVNRWLAYFEIEKEKDKS